MKYSQWIGIAAALTLIVACFIPWTYYPDLQKYFTGFYSEQNTYGKPGKLFIIIAILAIIFFLVPKVWAKRANWLVCAITVAYALRVYITYTSCYKGICPVKQPGIFIVEISVAVMMASALLPDLNKGSKK